MSKVLETRNVFLDTECFVQAGLHFDTAALKAFRKLCNQDKLKHITTTVVQREVKAKLKEAVKEGLDSIRNFQRKAKLLSSYNDEALKPYFASLPDDETYKKAFDVYDNFIAECKTKEANISEVSVEELLELYFSKEPPFGESKKKSEFPDAINMLALEQFATEKVYIVSKDLDLKDFCQTKEDFIYIEKLDELLDILNSHDEVLTNAIKSYISSNVEVIHQKISTLIEESDAWNASSWEDSTVESIKVCCAGDVEPKIVFFDDEECQVTFDIWVDYEVEVCGPDYANGIYDKEDDLTYTFGYTSRTQEFSEQFSVELFLNYEFESGSLTNVDIEECDIPSIKQGLDVCVEEQGDY